MRFLENFLKVAADGVVLIKLTDDQDSRMVACITHRHIKNNHGYISLNLSDADCGMVCAGNGINEYYMSGTTIPRYYISREQLQQRLSLLTKCNSTGSRYRYSAQEALPNLHQFAGF